MQRVQNKQRTKLKTIISHFKLIVLLYFDSFKETLISKYGQCYNLFFIIEFGMQIISKKENWTIDLRHFKKKSGSII